MRIILVLFMTVSLSGCWLGAITSSLGGQSGGTRVDTSANIGSDVQQGIGNEQTTTTQEVANNKGKITGRDSTQQHASSISNKAGITSWQLILIVLLCLLVPSPFTPLYERIRRRWQA